MRQSRLELVVVKSRIFSGRYLREFKTKSLGFCDRQITTILKQAEGGVPVSASCRKHEMRNASFYNWRAKFRGMDTSLISEMKLTADENRRLKRMYIEISMQNDLRKDEMVRQNRTTCQDVSNNADGMHA